MIDHSEILPVLPPVTDTPMQAVFDGVGLTAGTGYPAVGRDQASAGRSEPIARAISPSTQRHHQVAVGIHLDRVAGFDHGGRVHLLDDGGTGKAHAGGQAVAF